MATVTVQYNPDLKDTPVGAYLRAFNPTNRREVYNRVSQALWKLVRKHFRETEPTHHKTANSFSPAAQPTGYWEGAIRGTTKEFDADSATVTIAQPGISRAFHPLNIHAKGKLLTIPARPSPEAYGKRANQLSEKLFFLKTPLGVRMLATPTKETEGGKPYIAKPHKVTPDRVRRRRRPEPDAKRNFRPVYWLRESVRIKRDPSILPSRKTITDTATNEIAIGVRDFVLGRK